MTIKKNPLALSRYKTVGSLEMALPILLAILFFSFGCAIPLPSQGEVPTDNLEAIDERVSKEGKLPTVGVGSFECNKESVEKLPTVLAIVDASPDGLRIREAPDGSVLAIIPHDQTVVTIPSFGEKNWSYVFWEDGISTYCGYSASRFLKNANTE